MWDKYVSYYFSREVSRFWHLFVFCLSLLIFYNLTTSVFSIANRNEPSSLVHGLSEKWFIKEYFNESYNDFILLLACISVYFKLTKQINNHDV